MELQVSEVPVDIESPMSSTDQHLLQQLGTLPIHLRHAQIWPPDPQAESQNKFSDLELSVIDQNNQTLEIHSESSGGEELSVKTLADMFDFRLDDMPNKPPLAPQSSSQGPRTINIERIARQLSGLEPLNSL